MGTLQSQAQTEALKGCSGTELWAPFGDWGSPRGCFEASELQVTSAFLPAFFFSFSHPSSAPTPAPGQKGAAALLLAGWGERLAVKLRGPTSWLFWGVLQDLQE